MRCWWRAARRSASEPTSGSSRAARWKRRRANAPPSPASCAASRARLAAGDVAFFAGALPGIEHFRILPHAIEQAGFVDVETAEGWTVIGILDRDGPRSFRAGRDLHEFPSRAAAWKMIVTFN